MNGMRLRRAPLAGRFALSLSGLVVLALGFFPALAQADSSGIQYSDAPPTATGREPVPIDGGPSARPSTTPSGGAAAPHNGGGSNASGGHADSETEAASQGSGGSNAGNDGGTGQQSSPDNKSDGAANRGGEPAGQPHEMVAVEPASSDDDGSSPLLPILLGVLILAGISVAVFLMRQRRQRGGAPTLSEKAS